MREYILIEKSYLKSPTTRPLRLIHFAYLVLIFCGRKLLKSTIGHLFLQTFPTQHLFSERKLLQSTAGHLFLDTLPTQYLFYDRKLLKSFAGHLFLYILPTWHLFCNRKLLRPLPGIYFYILELPGTYFAVERFRSCALQLPGIIGFGLIALGSRACRHRVFFKKKQILKWKKNKIDIYFLVILFYTLLKILSVSLIISLKDITSHSGALPAIIKLCPVDCFIDRFPVEFSL